MKASTIELLARRERDLVERRQHEREFEMKKLQEKIAIEAVEEKARNAWKKKVDAHLQKQVHFVTFNPFWASVYVK